MIIDLQKQIVINAIQQINMALDLDERTKSLGIVAISKQLPAKLRPTKYKLTCPSCRRQITEKNCKKTEYKYCPTCGQALDWSDDE